MAWLTGWGFRKEVPLPTPSSNLVDVPVRVSLNADADFHEALATGYDIRFTAGDGETLLKYEREYWTGGNGSAATAEFWVKAPSVLSAGGNKVYIYYGNPDASDGEDAANVWDANFMGVYHLKDATSQTVADSTSPPQTGTKGADTEPTEVDGKIYKGQDFDGGDWINCQNPAKFQITGNITVETWFKTSTSQTNRGLIGKYASANYCYLLVYGFGGSANNVNFYIISGNTHYDANGAGANYNDGAWHHIVGRYNQVNVECWVDGGAVDAVGDASAGAIDNDAANLTIGNYETSQYFTGVKDEVRISNVYRSDAWLAFEYANIITPPVLGDEEEEEAGVTLVIADSTHPHAAESPVLTQAHVLAIAETLLLHLADNIDLIQAHILAIAEALHGLSSDPIILIQLHNLIIADALHAHTVDPIILSQAHQLAVSDGGHNHLADNITLDVGIMLIIQDALHGHSTDGITLSQIHQLLINNAAHGQTVDPILLSQVHNLAVNDILHDHLADNIDLITGALLVIADSLHGHTAENITLSQVHNLLINAGLHSLASDPIVLSQVHNLIVAGGLHGHLADNIDLVLEGIEYAKMGLKFKEAEDIIRIGERRPMLIGQDDQVLLTVKKKQEN